MPITHAPLPYADNALEPVISAKTISYHYGKHHAGYVNKLNGMIEGTAFAEMSLDDMIIASSREKNMGVFNNAAQIWNHDFFWQSMSADGGGMPSGKIADMINDSFGDFATFREKFVTAGMGQFGSGWVWLVAEGDKLVIDSTSNAHLPLETGRQAVLVCDVWEHAYYLDHQNDRKGFLDAFVDKLINWDFANQRLS